MPAVLNKSLSGLVLFQNTNPEMLFHFVLDSGLRCLTSECGWYWVGLDGHLGAVQCVDTELFVEALTPVL